MCENGSSNEEQGKKTNEITGGEREEGVKKKRVGGDREA